MATGDKIIIPAMAAGFVSLLGGVTKGAGDTCNLPAGMINIGGNGLGYLLSAQTDWDPLGAGNNDGSFTALALGNNIYLYAVQDASGTAKIIASVNSTYPTGYDATNSRKLGGCHYGRVRVVDANGTPIDGALAVYGADATTPWEANITTGIVPNSVWDLLNRPTCDPTGMAKVGNIWVDIYLASVDQAIGISNDKLTAGTSKSAYGGTPLTGTELLDCYLINELAKRTGKRLQSYDEWLAAAEGSPMGNDADNVNAWSDAANTARTTCGAVAYAISARNIVDCVGNVWERTRSQTIRQDGTAAWAWNDVMPGDGVGQLYMYTPTALVNIIVGGGWNGGANAGSRFANLNNYPWNVNTYIGSRFACDSL